MNGSFPHPAPAPAPKPGVHAALAPDTAAAVPLVLEVQHVTHYRYSAPVSLAHHLAHLQPLDDEHQQLLAFELDIDPPPDAGGPPPSAMMAAEPGENPPQMQGSAQGTAQAPVRGQTQGRVNAPQPLPMQAPGQEPGRAPVAAASADPAARVTSGAVQRFFSLTQPHRHLRVRASSRVRVAPRFAGLQAAQSPAWDLLAQSLRYQPGAPYQPAAQFAYPSPFVPRMQELRAYAEASLPAGRPVVQGALDLMLRIYRDFRYETDSTQIDTPLAQVLQQRRGVCQDFAHLMIGALRMLGLPARYVSGYLLTQPPGGGPALVGADATHAWVQLWCPGTPGVPATGEAAGWLDMDPTNNRVPGAGHVRLAVGRDFGDVTPLRGVIRGGGQHSLAVGVSTRVLPAP